MRVRILILALSLSVAVPALASDKVETGPTPAWAKPVVLPATTTADPVGVSARILIDSRHVRAEPGRMLVHSVTAMKFLTPDGLQGGNVSLQWRPDKDRVEVHKLAILRAGKEIDVLASGQKFTTIQREQNLEMAMFDGRLTAVLQPEGLQVGDTLYFEMTMTSSDPVMGRHVEFFSGLADQASAKRIDLRAEWPSGVDLAYRGYHLPAGKVTRQAGWTSVEWHLDDPAPFVAPKSSPARFRMGRRIEFSDTKSWDSIAALVLPLFDRAAVIPAKGALRDEVEKIRSASADPVARAEAALVLVEDRIRYVALLMDAGNYVPDSAETTWSRRFGDCKAKTALLTAILRELGIAADPVMVSSAGGDGLDQRLPMLASFDHVLVRATIAGRDYFLDGTRSGDWKLDRLAVPPFHWGLPLVANARLIPMLPSPLSRPQTETLIHLDASGGGGDTLAPARIERIFRGDLALSFNLIMGRIPQASRDNGLRDYWGEQFSRLTVDSTTASFDRAAGEYRLVAEGKMKLKLFGGRYEVDVPTLGYKPDFKRDAGPDRDSPLALDYPNYTRDVQTIVIPDALAGLGMSGDEPIDKTVAGVRYRRQISTKGSLFTIETSTQTLVPEIPFANALAAEAELRRMDDDDYEVVLARPTKADTEKVLAQPSVTGLDHLVRANALVAGERYAEAIVELDQSIALDTKRSESYETRGFAKLQINDQPGAKKDFETAAALGSTLPSIPMLKATEASRAKKWDEALVHIDQALKLRPEMFHILLMRAEVNRQRLDYAASLADSNRATALFPTNAYAYQFRINLLQRQGLTAEALAQADALLKLKLNDPYGYVLAAKTYAANGRQADAMRAFDRAIATKSEGYIYVNRAEVRPKSDVSGRLADLREGVRLDPDNADLRGMLGEHLGQSGDWKGAMEQFDKAILAEPTSVYPRIKRGLAYVRQGQADRAEADFAFVRAEAEKDALALNAMCWDKATANLALESALGDCDRALALVPEMSAYHDSRGLVLLRLGRIDDSIAAYDRALKSGSSSASFYGRALALARKGDGARSAADAAVAIKQSPKIAEQFKEYGLSLTDK